MAHALTLSAGWSAHLVAKRCRVAALALCFVGFGDFFFLDQTVQAACDGGEAFGHGCVRDVDHHHVHARDRTCLCDAIAHGAGADDAYGLNAHWEILVFGLNQNFNISGGRVAFG